MSRIIAAITNKKTWFNIGIGLRAACSLGGTALRSVLESRKGPTDILLCVVDHYEPRVGQPTQALARERVEDWMDRYPAIARAHPDADGRVPAHSFFYPWDEYDPWELDHIMELCGAGFGEVEIHLHHDGDTEDGVRQKFRDAVRTFRQHGALSSWPDGRPAWGFIHGNWALDNSRCEDDGGGYCGVNNELTVLEQEGCYADFTFPSWQHVAQPEQLNSIHYAIDDPLKPKSYNRGLRARVGEQKRQGLLLVQGPLAPYVEWSSRRTRVAMDDGDISISRRYKPERFDRWVRTGVHVQGRPDLIFIKLHSHGAEDRNRAAMLGEDMEWLFRDAGARYNDGVRYRLHHTTAREMYNIVKATEAGISDMAAARDWILKPPGSAASRNEAEPLDCRRPLCFP